MSARTFKIVGVLNTKIKEGPGQGGLMRPDAAGRCLSSSAGGAGVGFGTSWTRSRDRAGVGATERRAR